MSVTEQRLFDLPQDLRLAEHQRIQPACHPHQMTDSLIILMPVKAGHQFLRVDVVIAAQPVNQLIALIILFIHTEIDFCPVAGRQHNAAAHGRLFEQIG